MLEEYILEQLDHTEPYIGWDLEWLEGDTLLRITGSRSSRSASFDIASDITLGELGLLLVHGAKDVARQLDILEMTQANETN